MAASILTTKSTYRSLSAQLLSERTVEIFTGHCWIITQSDNCAIVHKFILLNVNLHQAANAEFELEQSETEHAA
jgi:hypothetical protein